MRFGSVIRPVTNLSCFLFGIYCAVRTASSYQVVLRTLNHETSAKKKKKNSDDCWRLSFDICSNQPALMNDRLKLERLPKIVSRHPTFSVVLALKFYGLALLCVKLAVSTDDLRISIHFFLLQPCLYFCERHAFRIAPANFTAV